MAKTTIPLVENTREEDPNLIHVPDEVGLNNFGQEVADYIERRMREMNPAEPADKKLCDGCVLATLINVAVFLGGNDKLPVGSTETLRRLGAASTIRASRSDLLDVIFAIARTRGLDDDFSIALRRGSGGER